MIYIKNYYFTLSLHQIVPLSLNYKLIRFTPVSFHHHFQRFVHYLSFIIDISELYELPSKGVRTFMT